jgi:hypothetical protein
MIMAALSRFPDTSPLYSNIRFPFNQASVLMEKGWLMSGYAGDQPQSAAATIEVLALPRRSSREPQGEGGEDV